MRPRAKRDAHAKLARAAGRPRHHEVAEIRRRHDQDQLVSSPSSDTTPMNPMRSPARMKFDAPIAGSSHSSFVEVLRLLFAMQRRHRRRAGSRGPPPGETPSFNRPYIADVVRVPVAQERAVGIVVVALVDREPDGRQIEIEPGKLCRHDADQGRPARSLMCTIVPTTCGIGAELSSRNDG